MEVAATIAKETELIRRAAAGDRSAYTALVETHRRRVFFLARDLCGNSEDAEDLAQEVFVKLYRKLDSFKGSAQLSTWLHRVTLNAYIDSRRSRAEQEKKQTVAWDPPREKRGSYYPGDVTAPEALVLGGQIRGQVEEALESLSPRERAAFVLRHFRDTPVREIAGSMGVREGTVKSLLFRGVRKLQSALAHLEPQAGKEGAK